LAAFWAESTKSFVKIDWQAERNIKKICEDIWLWHKLNLTGYGKE